VPDPDPGKSEGGDSREVRRVGGGGGRSSGSGICFVLFYFEGIGRREWMGDGCGSGTGLDPDTEFIDNFFDKQFYNSVKIGPNFFL
jgi:hypothetical protein